MEETKAEGGVSPPVSLSPFFPHKEKHFRLEEMTHISPERARAGLSQAGGARGSLICLPALAEVALGPRKAGDKWRWTWQRQMASGSPNPLLSMSLGVTQHCSNGT